MLGIGLAALLTALVQEPPKPAELTLSLAVDKTECVVGEEIQAEVTLANPGTEARDVAELVFEERSLGFDISFEPEPGKKRSFVFTVTRPDPHLVDRVAPVRVMLGPKKMLTGIFKIPVLKPGPLTVTAKYAGTGKEVASTGVTVTARALQSGESRLAAILETGQGSMTVVLKPEEAPNSVSNFVLLAKRKYFDNLVFFRVAKNFVIQTGCPYDNGYGGPGYALRSEAKGQQAKHDAGTVALSQQLKSEFTGSQFYIALGKVPSLDGKYTVIGRIEDTPGLEVLKKFESVKVDRATERPEEDIALKKVTIVVVK